jgi:branched-chain amino acid transport system permease protein
MFPERVDFTAPKTLATIALVVLVALVPLISHALTQPYYVTLASRIIIYALAASSLNLILGYGGMVSFGHALYFGLGAYAVGILSIHGIFSGWIHLLATLCAAGLVALITGVICLRTRGMAFIMITLAFAQMMYYLFISLRSYGGEDGLTLTSRSVLGFGLDAKSDVTFYYVALAFLAAIVFLLHRLVHARFGRVLEGIRENETRMQAIGFATYRYKLIAFAIAGAVAGLAGALLANQSSFVSPALLHWSQSGTLMIMVILGGVGQLYGGVLGAAIYLILEEALSARTIHWQLGLGIVLLAVVLYARGGIAAIAMQFLTRRRSSGG